MKVVSIEGINISDTLDKVIRTCMEAGKGDVYLVKIGFKSNRPPLKEDLVSLKRVLESILDTSRIIIVPSDLDISIESIRVEEI